MLNNNESPLVSIVVPIYNAERTLEACLKSILAQTISDYEVILIDDGSKDRSPAICNEFAKEYGDKIRYIRQENSGPATARNTGIDNSKGKYIGFVDADDTIAPNMLQVMTEAAEQNQVDMVICAYWWREGKKEKIVTYNLPEGIYKDAEYKSVPLSLIGERDGDVPPYSWVRLTRRNAFERTGLRFQNGLVRSEDYHFWTKVQFGIDSVYLLSKTPLYYYIDNKSSITHTHVKEYWNGAKFIYNDLRKFLPEDSEVKQKIDVMLVHRSLIALNNAAFNENIVSAWKEMREIVYDKQLNKVVGDLQNSENQQFKRFRKLMTSHKKWLVVLKYMIRKIRS